MTNNGRKEKKAGGEANWIYHISSLEQSVFTYLISEKVFSSISYAHSHTLRLELGTVELLDMEWNLLLIWFCYIAEILPL